jgi:F-type H+-transporting ATPase subunit b
MAETSAHTESTAAPESAGGLPQFDPSWWPGQIVWLLVIFLVIYLLMAKVFVPRVGGTIADREDRITGDIAQARRLKEEAEKQAAEAAAETAKARARAQKLAAEAKARVTAEAATRQGAEEARLAENLAVAEAGIRTARDQAMSHVRAIAAESAGAIVTKLTGQAASTKEVEAALAGRA